MAERVESGNEGEVTDESKARKRKPNFSVNEISVITENVKNHLAVIQSKLTNNITNRKKKRSLARNNRCCECGGDGRANVS